MDKARFNPAVDTQLDRDIKALRNGIRNAEDALMHKDDPAIQPFLNRFRKQLEGVERDLDEFGRFEEIPLRLLLQRRMDLRRILAFDDLEDTLEDMRAALASKEERLNERQERRKT